MSVAQQLNMSRSSLDEASELLEQVIETLLEPSVAGFVSGALFEAQMLEARLVSLRSKITHLEVEYKNFTQDIERLAKLLNE